MGTIAEVNAENARAPRTENDALSGLTVAADAAKAAREAAREARAEAARLAKAAADAAKAARDAKANAPKMPTARDAVREIDAEILSAADEIAKRIAETYPEGLRYEIASLVSAQLHHLASPKREGWVAEYLPVPDRSEWK